MSIGILIPSVSLLFIISLGWTIWTILDTKYKFREFRDGKLTITRSLLIREKVELDEHRIREICRLTLNGAQYGFTIRTMRFGDIELRNKDDFDADALVEFARHHNIPLTRYELNYNLKKEVDQ